MLMLMKNICSKLSSPSLWLGLMMALVFPGYLAAEVAPFEIFLKQHCVRCHGPDAQEGDVRIDTLSRDFAKGIDSQHWGEIIERVNAGEMPPKDEAQPTQAEIATFVPDLDARIKAGRAARMAARPAVAHYRLSRTEYANTVYDLLGVRYDPTKPGELNEDTLWHGYERIGSELALSPSHVDRYYRAAGIVLDRAFPTVDVDSQKVRMTAAELRYNGGEKQQEALDRFGITRPLRYLLFPGRTQPALRSNWLGSVGPEHSGLYKLRIKASGIKPLEGQPAHLSVGIRTSEETVDGLIEFDVTAGEDSPEVYEFGVFLEMPASLDFAVVATNIVDRRGGAAFRNAIASRNAYIFTHSSETHLLNPNAPQMFDDKGNGIFSTVILDWLEWEGPLVTDAEKTLQANVIPPDDSPLEVVAEHLERFTARAWRRQVERHEIQNYLDAFEAERDAGESMKAAFCFALQGVLTSRNFIYLVEGSPVARPELTDTELATRLSYFLWSSMPDDALLTTAQAGQLQGERLTSEVDRILGDERINRFIDDFSRQWLQLHRVGMFPPDRTLFPTYDDWLETSMGNEPVEYFREMFGGNLPIEQLIQSDWTMVNARLSDFYGLPEPDQQGFQRIALEPSDQRGGLLTMGGVLGLTSDGTRHRPVHRGVWISEAILNRTPPNPPANVDPIAPTPPESPKATIREKLAVHAKDANCAACHRSIDPLGFAFEQYDAVGQWRTREAAGSGSGEDPLVDASGTLPDGRTFANASEFKQLLVKDRTVIARAFIEHLCTYALRRVLTIDDQDAIDQILEQAEAHQFKVKDIIRAVALSELIRTR